MTYFVDFDRTLFDTPAWKVVVRSRPSIVELLTDLEHLLLEARSLKELRHFWHLFTRTLGTFLSHGRFLFTSEEVSHYLYPDSADFIRSHDVVIVTYGARAFITAKVTSALHELPVKEVVYTKRHKGRTLARLARKYPGPHVFIDDAVFQLASVSRWCPEMTLIEMRRDGNARDGRWPCVRTLSEAVRVAEEAVALAKAPAPDSRA